MSVEIVPERALRPEAGDIEGAVHALDKRRQTEDACWRLDAGLLEAIDDEARRRGLTRSAFLASAAQDKILGRT